MRAFATMIAMAVPLLLLFSGARAAIEATNLLRNGDFEAPDMPPPGWRINALPEFCELTPLALTGKQALKLKLPSPGTITVQSDPCPVAAGDAYAYTCWYRTDGLSGKGLVRCYVDLVWQNAAGNNIGSCSGEMPNGPVPDYRVATSTELAPPGAVTALLKFTAVVGSDYTRHDCAFYLDQVRLMHLSAPVIPPNAPKWSYTGRMPSDSLKLVPDKDAAQGEVLLAAVGASGYLSYGPYSMEQPVGDYLINFRLKVRDNTKNTPVASLDVTAPGSIGYVLARRTILASDFKAPGVYQDIAMRFVRPEEGMLEFRVSYAGTTDLWYDGKTVVQLAAYPTDREQAAIWLGGDAGGTTTAAPVTATHTALVLAGPDNRILFPAEALSKLLPVKSTFTYLACIQTGFVLDQPLPKSLDKLNDVNLVVLANVPAAALNGLMGRRTLRQFVERGGGLLVFGGSLSLGKGGFAGSAFDSALPVNTTGGWDLVKAAAPVVKVAKDSPITRGFHWNTPPQVCYYQRVIPRPGAEVLLTCEGAPILVTGTCGKGRVAIFAATDLGDSATGQIPFYGWPDYLPLLAHVTQWLLGP